MNSVQDLNIAKFNAALLVKVLFFIQNTPDHAVRLLVDSVTRKFDFTDKWSDASLAIGFKAEAITLYRRLLDVATECDTGVKLPTKVVEIDERSRDCAFLWLNLW